MLLCVVFCTDTIIVTCGYPSYEPKESVFVIVLKNKIIKINFL